MYVVLVTSSVCVVVITRLIESASRSHCTMQTGANAAIELRPKNHSSTLAFLTRSTPSNIRISAEPVDRSRPLTGCGKSGILGPDMGYNARCVTRCGGTADAEDCGRGAGCTDGGIREGVRQVRTAVDSS